MSAAELAKTNIVDPALLECPYAFEKRLRAEAPVLRDEATGFYQVSSHALVCEVLRDHETYSAKFRHVLQGKHRKTPAVEAIMAEGYPPVDTLHTSDPPEHTRSRKLVNKGFTVARVNAMEPDIQRTVDALIDSFASRGAVEFVSEFAQLLPMLVIAGQLGVPAADLPKFREWSDAFSSQYSHVAGEEGEVAAARKVVAFQHYFGAKLAEKRAVPGNDIISELANATLAEEGDARRLDDAEAVWIIQQILVAGNETTAHSLTEGMKLLIEHPAQMQAVLENPDLIGNFAEETVRVLTPVYSMWRIATRDAVLGGIAIPKGALVLCRFGSANRDAAVFANAEEFDVQRGDIKSHIAFGYGIHLCVGAQLGRKELQVAFRTLLTRLKHWRFAPGNDFTHHPSILLRGMKQLHLQFDRA